MSDQARIEQLEARVAEMENRLTGRIAGVLGAMAAAQGVTIDALALLAMRDRALVENLLKMRRLNMQDLHRQGRDHAEIEALVVKWFEVALEQADMLSGAGSLGPR